jgi:hypothetical protein
MEKGAGQLTQWKARAVTLEYPGELYRVFNRGNSQQGVLANQFSAFREFGKNLLQGLLGKLSVDDGSSLGDASL